jgi:DNA-binding MarR family transcriptional regulator
VRPPAKRQAISGLDDKPGFLIRRAHQISDAIFDAETEGFGITPPQHVIMTALYSHPGIDQATLASLVGLDKVTVGQMIRRLERRGLAQRTRSKVDRRAQVLLLSSHGSSVLLEMQAAARRSRTKLLKPLTAAERKHFIAMIRRIVTGAALDRQHD